MDTTKSWWQSTTIWAGLVTVISFIGGLLGYQVVEADQQSLTAIISGVVGGIGGLFAIWGRVKASKTVGTP